MYTVIYLTCILIDGNMIMSASVGPLRMGFGHKLTSTQTSQCKPAYGFGSMVTGVDHEDSQCR